MHTYTKTHIHNPQPTCTNGPNRHAYTQPPLIYMHAHTHTPPTHTQPPHTLKTHTTQTNKDIIILTHLRTPTHTHSPTDTEPLCFLLRCDWPGVLPVPQGDHAHVRRAEEQPRALG